MFLIFIHLPCPKIISREEMLLRNFIYMNIALNIAEREKINSKKKLNNVKILKEKIIIFFSLRQDK